MPGPRRPLDADRLAARAMAYLARHAASRARVAQVLARAVARAGGPDGGEPEDAAALIEGVLARLDRAGLLDDDAFALARTARLARKGRPAAAIRLDLAHNHGIDTAAPGVAEALGALDPLAQARRLAERRRLGPFRLRDRQGKRDADIASLARAGFPVSVARRVIDGGAGEDEEG